MSWLLLDTACPRAMVAIARHEKIVAAIYLNESLKHGEKLAGAIQTCLNEAALEIQQLSGVAVGQGPGSFVGVRVAIAHAKGIGMALQIPLVGVCTLSAIAAAPDLPLAEGMAFLDARRGEFYARHIKRVQENGKLQIVPLAEPCVLSTTDIEKLALTEKMGGFYTLQDNPDYFEQPGVLAQGMLFMLQQRLANVSAGENLDEVFSLTPAYVRAPDAKIAAFYQAAQTK